MDKSKREYWPTYEWRVSKPSEQGMSTEILFDLFYNLQLNNNNINSVLIIKNGYIVAEGYAHPFNKDFVEQIYCITKPFISTMIGILIREGKIKSVNQRVLDFFNYETLDHMTCIKDKLTIKDLLTNTTGFEWGDVFNSEALSDIQVIGEMFLTDDWGKFCLDKEVLYERGKFFTSNSNGCQLLASIIRNVTGMSPHNYAKEKIFKPLGINDTLWFTSSNGENSGAQGLFMKPRDVAKLGLLYLSNGDWEDQSIIDNEWVEESTTFQVETRDSHKRDFFVGYGYQWFFLSELPFNTYCAYGAYGHFLLVVKDLDLICVTSGSIPLDQHKRAIYNIFKNYIIPSYTNFKPTNEAADNKVYQQLQDVVFNMENPEPKNDLYIADNYIQTMNNLKYHFDENNTFMFIENVFNKLLIESLTLQFINHKVCKLEITTYCDQYYIILVSLTSNFLTTKVMTEYGEVPIAARCVFEDGYILNIIYYTNYSLKNSLKIICKDKNSIECSFNNVVFQFTGIKGVLQ